MRLNEVKKIINFYFFEKKQFNIIASLKRSGWNYTEAVINSAICDVLKIPNKIIFKQDKYYSYYNCSKPLDFRGIIDAKQYNEKLIFHTHKTYEQIFPSFKKKSKIIVIFRDPIGYIKSSLKKYFLIKNIKKKKITLNDFIEIDNQQKFIAYYNNFLNSWSNYSDNSKILFFKNYQIKSAPLKYFKKINSHFNLLIKDKFWLKAIKQCSLFNQRKNFDFNTIRISQKDFFLKEEINNYVLTKCNKYWHKIDNK